MMPSTIVVPLDGSPLAERAVDVAAPLAHQLGVGVLLTATTYGDPRVRLDYLDHVAALAGTGSLTTRVEVDRDPADWIAQVVKERPDAMLCMTTHGRGRLRWSLAGSVAEEVIHTSTRPIMLVGPRGTAPWSRGARRIVVCVDGTEAAQRATDAACEWARALDLEVHLVFATHPLDVESSEHPESIFRPCEQIVRAHGLPVHTDQLFRSSFIGGALVDYAEEPPATMIVMGAHPRGPLARLVLGSTTMAVLNVSSCPVLIVPPEED